MTSSRAATAESFTYDRQDRVASVTREVPGRLGQVTSYEYVNAGVSKVTYPSFSRQSVSYSYDSVGQVDSLVLNGATTLVGGVSFNAAGQVTRIDRGAGVNSLRTDFGYGVADYRLVGQGTTTGSGELVRWGQYRWSADGNLEVTAEAQAGRGRTVTCATYDEGDRLDQSWSQVDWDAESTGPGYGCSGPNGSGPEPFQIDMDYDPAGRILSATGTGTVGGDYQYAGFPRHTPKTAGGGAGFRRYNYDRAGNRTLERDSTNRVTGRWAYDVLGRQVNMYRDGHRAKMLYTASGERAYRETTNEKSWFYPGGFRWVTTSGGTTSVTDLSVGGDVAVTLEAGVYGRGREIWYHATNHLGTPAMSRSSTGQTTFSQRTTPFGQPRSPQSAIDWPTSGRPTDIGFTGQISDRVCNCFG